METSNFCPMICRYEFPQLSANNWRSRNLPCASFALVWLVGRTSCEYQPPRSPVQMVFTEDAPRYGKKCYGSFWCVGWNSNYFPNIWWICFRQWGPPPSVSIITEHPKPIYSLCKANPPLCYLYFLALKSRALHLVSIPHWKNNNDLPFCLIEDFDNGTVVICVVFIKCKLQTPYTVRLL